MEDYIIITNFLTINHLAYIGNWRYIIGQDSLLIISYYERSVISV